MDFIGRSYSGPLSRLHQSLVFSGLPHLLAPEPCSATKLHLWLLCLQSPLHLNLKNHFITSIHPSYHLVMICDTRSGNRSCDRSGDFSPTFSMFVYVC